MTLSPQANPISTNRRQLVIAGAGLALCSSGVAVEKEMKAASRTPVSILDFGGRADGKFDNSRALSRAISSGEDIIFPQCAEPYLFASDVDATIERDTIIDGAHATLLSIDGTIRIGTPVRSQGTLTRDTVAGASTLHLSKVEGLAQGNLLYLTDNRRPSPDWDYRVKDLLLVKRVGASGNVECVDPASFAYRAGRAQVAAHSHSPQSLSLFRFSLRHESAGGDRRHRPAFLLEGLSNVVIDDIHIAGALPFDPRENINRIGIALYRVHGWRISNARYRAMSYPVGVYGASRNGSEKNVAAYFCRHGHADVGDWARSYELDSFSGRRCVGALSCHPFFDFKASNIDVRDDLALSNMRCIGGSLTRAYIHCPAPAESSQFASVRLESEFEDLNARSVFEVDQTVFNCPNFTNNPDLHIQRAGSVNLSNLRCFYPMVGLSGKPIKILRLGKGNFFSATRSSSLYRPAIFAKKTAPLA